MLRLPDIHIASMPITSLVIDFRKYTYTREKQVNPHY